MRVTIIGTGYVGLVSGVCLAAKGHDVTCVDINPAVVRSLNDGVPTIYEVGLEDLLAQTIAAGRFAATSELREGLEGSDGVIIAVGTPSKDGAIDLTYVRQVSQQIGAWLRDNDTFLPIVVKSTVLPGTTDSIVKQDVEAGSGKALGRFGLGMNPEFLREGNAVRDFMEPDRIVLGYEDPGTLSFLQSLYAPWGCDKLRVNTRTAEMIKYSNNALLAVQISAVNELANFAAAIGGIDIMNVMKGIHLDKRWNPIINGRRVSPEILTYLVPGCGFGGSCFPKDVQAVRTHGEQLGLPMEMMNAVLSVNTAQPLETVFILERELGSLVGRKCLVLGLAFKPNTDDVRESPSLPIIRELVTKGAEVVAHDPIASESFKLSIGESSVSYCSDWKPQVSAADIIIVLVACSEYRELRDENLTHKILFDARRIFAVDPPEVKQYLSIGRRI